MAFVSAVVFLLALIALWKFTNVLSYRLMKQRILDRQSWGLNICCGTTDGGGVNADVMRHAELPRFVLVDVYRTPFREDEFETVLCSHTIEHVEDPERLFDELQRIGDEVTLVLPPLWDFTAAFNLLEHRWLFLTFKKEHTTLPPYVRLPLARTVQRLLGQRMHA
jgi:hypothetical protein